MNDKLSFEQALEELNETVSRLEAGELSLEASLVLFERGQWLANYCQKLLDEASLKVEMLTNSGEIVVGNG